MPDATECPRSASESIALVLGQQRGKSVSAPKPHRVRALVSELRDEFRDAVHELSGVFKMSDIAPPPRKVGTRTSPLGERIARARTSPVHDEWAEPRTTTGTNMWAPERTIVGTAPIRPRSLKKAPPKPPPARRASIGFDTSDLTALDRTLPFDDDKTSVESNAFNDGEATRVDGRRIR